MDTNLTPTDLRSAARYVEETARSALASYSALPVPRYSGGPGDFPRPSYADQAALEGVDDLREMIGQTVTSLHAVASMLEKGLAVPPTLWVPIQPYIDAYLAEQGAEPKITEEAAESEATEQGAEPEITEEEAEPKTRKDKRAGK